jgi:hypothetical protein
MRQVNTSLAGRVLAIPGFPVSVPAPLVSLLSYSPLSVSLKTSKLSSHWQCRITNNTGKWG